jgi:hypothetical protein
MSRPVSGSPRVIAATQASRIRFTSLGIRNVVSMEVYESSHKYGRTVLSQTVKGHSTTLIRPALHRRALKAHGGDSDAPGAVLR